MNVGRILDFGAVASVLAFALPVLADDAPNPPGVAIERDVSYLAEGRGEKADLYLPAGRPEGRQTPAGQTKPARIERAGRFLRPRRPGGSAGRRPNRELAPVIRPGQQSAHRVEGRVLAVVLEEVGDAVRTTGALLHIPLVAACPQVHVFAGGAPPLAVPPVFSLFHAAHSIEQVFE